MHRLVVAATALLLMVGAAVVAGYLLLFSDVPDRAARAAPADTAIYLNVYLQPSSGQKLSLLALVERLPGFRDAATVEGKVHEVAQRLLGQAGIDYEADVRDWLGAQVAIALAPSGDLGSAPQTLLIAAVKDHAAASSEVPRLMARGGTSYRSEAYRGQRAMLGATTSYALLDDLLLVADTPKRLHAALDAEADVTPSLADLPAFDAAMSTIPADHLASIFVDAARAVSLAGSGHLGGYSTAALALTARGDGLHLDGIAPFATDVASAATRQAFALGSKTSSLTAWMPSATRGAVVLFGLQQSLADLEAEMGSNPAFGPATDALNQLRAIAALGLGVNVDRDLLPLFDAEAAVAVTDLDPPPMHGQLLLRPADSAAAAAALDRMRDGLASRGSSVSTSRAAGATITSLTVPGIGRLAYATADGVVILAFDAADVAASLEAHASGRTLARDDRYRTPFKIAGMHAGNELWTDVPGLLDAAAGIFDPGSELRDILHQIGELAMSASASGDHLEVHGVLTVK
ncbi:MAG: DUF3352 domain-containing protein [Chloroflexota bacterium]|nr:DUF3352 domain-containing protein [Chloroflexota bacterium]